MVTQAPQVCLHLPLRAAESWTNPRCLTSLHSQITICLRNSTYVRAYEQAHRPRLATLDESWSGLSVSLDAVTSSLIDPLLNSDRGIICCCMGVTIATGPFSMQGDVECCWKLGDNWGCWGGKGGLVGQDVCEEKWCGGCWFGGGLTTQTQSNHHTEQWSRALICTRKLITIHMPCWRLANYWDLDWSHVPYLVLTRYLCTDQ